jgi:hypothetical protein
VRGCQFSVDRFENAASVLEYVVVPEAENRKRLRSQECVAATIVVATGVLRSVGFDNQAALKTHEIHDVGIDDELPFELE